jgi:Leishmanolysin
MRKLFAAGRIDSRDDEDAAGASGQDIQVYVWSALGGRTPADVTELDFASFAKGGKPGGGGGGGGSGGGVVTQYFSGSANGDAGYDIWIEFKGTGWTVDLQKAFINAANYFTTVITADIGGGLYRGKIIDDLYVAAEVKAIDGVNGVLGQAGPSVVWTSNDLTAAGQMQFDIADASALLVDGLWDDTVTHEFMHVLGFGTLWDYGSHSNLVTGFQYTGANALDAYQDVHANATYIPIEDGGGSGTAGGHWDEQQLNNELMTGWINDDGDPSTTTDNYLSDFSVMVLADLGYTVNYQDYPYDGWPLVA